MILEIGQTGQLNWIDGTTAKVKIVGRESYSFLPADYWFEYQEGETNKQLIHPDFGKFDYIKAEVLLPEEFAQHLFKPNDI